MGLSRPVKYYIGFIFILGFAIIFFCASQSRYLNASSILAAAFSFLILGAMAESLPIRLDKENLVAISSTVSIATILLFGAPMAVLLRFLASILAIRRSSNHFMHLFNSPIYKTLFNGFGRAITVFFAGYSYQICSGWVPHATFLNFNIAGLLGLVIVYFSTDTLIFQILFALLNSTRLITEIQKKMWTVWSLLLLSPFGVLIAGMYQWQGIFPVFLMLGPFMFIRSAFEQGVQIQNTFKEVIVSFSKAVEAKDLYTDGHSHRVAQIAISIAQEMNRPRAKIDELYYAAVLHDIGKIGVSDHTLHKLGKLEPEEMEELYQHPVIGAQILEQVKQLATVAKIVRYHHIWYDGRGYPPVPEGDVVPLESYILAVSDAYDAITTDRSYRKADTKEVALQKIQDGAGQQFHPKVVEALLVCMNNKTGEGEGQSLKLFSLNTMQRVKKTLVNVLTESRRGFQQRD